MDDFTDKFDEFVDEPKEQNGEQSTSKWKFHWHGEEPPEKTRPQLIQDLIPEVGAGLIAGQWGTYKTFCALDLAAAVMIKGTFIKFPVLRQGGVLFVACEGQNEVSIRLEGVLRDKCSDIDKAPFVWVEASPRLLDKNAGKELAELIRAADEEMQQRFNLPVVLVIIDTYGKAAAYDHSGQENNSATNKIVMRNLSEAALATRIFVLAVDHFGKVAETGTRGSSSKEDDADVVLALLGDKDITGSVSNTRLAIRKRRNGANGDAFPFRPRVVNIGDGGVLTPTTLVLDWSDHTEGPAHKPKMDQWSKKSLRLLKRVLMNISASCGSDRRPYPDGPVVRAVNIETVRTEFYKDYPASGADDNSKQGARQKAFRRAVDDAHAASLIGCREIDGVTYIWLAAPAVGA